MGSEWIESFTAAAEEQAGKAPQALLRVLAALLVLAATFLVLRLGRKAIRRVYTRWRKKHPLPRHDGKAVGDENTAFTLAMSLFRYLVYFAAALACLSTLGVNVTSLLAMAGFGSVAIAFGCQTLVKDFVTGLFMWVDGYVKVGDVITVNGSTGTVENLALRTTTLRGVNGNLIVIPNGDIRSLTNMTRDYRCALVDVTVAHGQDYESALRVLESAMAELDKKLPEIGEPPQVMGYIGTDARAATVRIECRCDIADCWKLERDIRLAALEAFRRADIKP